MSTHDSGFSFGVVGNDSDDDDIVDAIEVSGEPVSRAEASKLGITAFETSYRAKSGTTLIRIDHLPKIVTEEDSDKLKLALQQLQQNNIEEALTLAQEVVWEYPDLIPAKLIIARCFINRKEYKKCLAILNVIPDLERDSEVMYYMALAQSRLGEVREAIVNLKRLRTVTAEPLVRKRANDLLLHLQGEKTLCPICGKQTLYDSMMDVGDETVCPNCAKTLAEKGVVEVPEDEEGDEDLDDEQGNTKRRKKLRPPLTKWDIAIRVLFGVFMLAVLLFGVYILQFISPDTYRSVRPLLPASWTFLPPIVTDIPTASQPEGPQPPRVVQTMVFDSPALTRAVEGVPLRHQLVIQGMENRDDADYRVQMTPTPTGPYSLDPLRGVFSWTPSSEDAGTVFTITFTGVFTTVQSMDQVNTVSVSAAPSFKSVCTLAPRRPGEVTYLAAHDMDRDGDGEILVVSGRFWDGTIGVYQETADGFYKLATSTTFPGRPAGAGVIRADDEYWIAVADYWNSRLRLYALRSGHIAEMALSFDLPGRPVLAGFDSDASLAAVLCRTDDSQRVLVFRQDGQLKTTRLGEWVLPDEQIWQRILIVPAEDEDASPFTIIAGGTARNGLYILVPEEKTPVLMSVDRDGEIIDAASGPGGILHCLVRDGDTMSVVTLTPRADGTAENISVTPAGGWPALSGLAGARFSPAAPSSDTVVLSTDEMRVGLSLVEGQPATVQTWPLPKPARVLGNIVTMPGRDGASPRILYLDVDRDIWTIEMNSDGGTAR